ncbi:hypothetical protein BOTBODRAFT_635776, partial [Botryobasidium botryosum FD-172 SS1]
SSHLIKLNTLFQIHDIYLTPGSGPLLALVLEEIVPSVRKHGLLYGICSKGAWTLISCLPRLKFYYIINHYIKYVELLESLESRTDCEKFEHPVCAITDVFHHSATAVLCYVQLQGHTSVVLILALALAPAVLPDHLTSWVPIALDLTVHVFMYYHYYATAGGRRIWWKKHLTTMQITQLVIDIDNLFIVLCADYSYIAATYFPHLPHQGNCYGKENATVIGSTLLTSYLFLFINFTPVHTSPLRRHHKK